MITPISFNNHNKYKINQHKQSQNMSNVVFCARPEYENLSNIYHRPRESGYFRREGGYIQTYLDECKGTFQDVIDVLKFVYGHEAKPKVLVAGIGKAEEPFSILAVAKDLYKRKKIEDIIDLNCVDLQPKIHDAELIESSYIPYGMEPKYAESSFVTVKRQGRNYLESKVMPEVFEYVRNVFNNPEKTKFNTKIEEFAQVSKSNDFDFISLNQVLMYINDKKAQINLMENLTRMLKWFGVLVTDKSDNLFREQFKCLEKFKNINPGIWLKVR